MDKILKNRYALPVFFLLLIVYLVINTGIVSDDISNTADLRGVSIMKMLTQPVCLHTPAEIFFFFIWYPLFSFDNSVLVSILKIFYIFMSFLMISKFFGIYLSRAGAFLVSFIFIFFPSHDATVYWFLGQYLTISMAFYLYAYYLAHRGRLTLSFLAAAAASFISYGSPAIALSLFCLFAMNRQFKKGFVILIPNILYSIYYVFITKVMAAGIDRIPKSFDILAVMKQFFLQVMTFADSVCGPSLWLKIYYSFSQLSPLSIIAFVIALLVLGRAFLAGGRKYDIKLTTGLAVMTVLSLGMFSLTGYYPQLAFNLGDRTTIFGSLLISYLLVASAVPDRLKLILFSVLVLSIFGISDHWKSWNAHQQVVMNNIRDNPELKGFSGAVYVSGNQYSKYGNMSHIEFLSEDSVTGPLFRLFSGGRIEARPLNKRHKYEDGYLVDIKYGGKTKVGGYIYVYDSQNDKLLKIKAEDINRYIESLPGDNRHWTQLIHNRYIKDAVLTLMPRVRYAF